MQTTWPTGSSVLEAPSVTHPAQSAVMAQAGITPSGDEHAVLDEVDYGVSAVEAWECWVRGYAVLVDVRSPQDWLASHAIPDALEIPWRDALSYRTNPYFIDELQHLLASDRMAIMVCNTGWASREAAQAARQAGFAHVYYVCDGLSGDGFPTW